MFNRNKKMLFGVFLLTFFLLIIGNVSASDNITSDSGLLNQIDDSNLDKIGLYNINDVESNSISNEEYLKSSSDEVIINPNFDDGLDNWTSSGTVQVQTGQEGNGIYMRASRGTSSISQSVDLTNVESIGFYYKVSTYVTGSSSFIVSAGDASESLDLSVSDWTYGEIDTSSVSGVTDLKFALTETGSRPAIILIDTIAAHTNTFVLTVDFISNVTIGMDELEVQFNGTSNGNVIEWLWDFGDGETAAGQNVTHKYSKIGSYDVTLKTWYADNPNSTLTKNNYINVHHTSSIIKNPDFENYKTQNYTEFYNATDDTYIVTRYFDGWFSISSVYPVTYNWENANWLPKSGNYVLILASDKVSIRPDPNQSWRDKTTGQPSVSQVLNFDYIDSISFYVLASSADLNVTVGDVYLEQVNLINPNSSNGEWQLVTINTSDKSIFKGEQSFKITYSELITLNNLFSTPKVFIDAFSCTYSDLTHSNFTYSIDSITNKYFNIQFNNEAYGSITSFFWDFGDGTNSTEIDPMHNFKPGTYNVKLTASNVNHTDEYSYTLVLEDFPTIGNIIYKSIQDAIDNADDGDVIDITKDLSENIIIDKNLTLNFNGNKLTGAGSSPVIQVTGGAQATIKNITFEDSTVLSTDDESSLTVTESNIADTNITLSTGNIALDGNDFNGSFITIANANAVIANNNVTNAGIKVNGGKSKINDNILSGNDVAIVQTAGETDIISNLITNNAVGVNITGGSANVNFNALYDNTNVSLAYVGTVNADNNWFAVFQPSFSNTVLEGYVDVYAPGAEQPAWLVLTLNTNETELYTTQDYTITVDLTLSNIENTSALGKLPKLVLPVSTEMGESSTTVTVENGVGEFTLTTGNLASDNVTFTIKGEEYSLYTEIVANVIDTTLTIESVENGVVTVTLKDVDGNVISDADVTYTVNSGNQITDKIVDGKITISGLKGTVTIAAEYAGVTDYPYYNRTTASETFNFAYDGNINITIPESAKTTVTPSITIQLPTDAQGTVNIFVDAKIVNTTTITGTTTIPLSDLGAGEHIVEVKYNDDDIYLPAEKTGNLIVSKVTPTITATGSSVGENETATVEVNIDGATGIVLVEVAGNKYFAELETGSATVNVVGLKAGNYAANIKYSGDDKYAENTATADISVSEVEDKTITELKAELVEAKENATQLLNNLTEANKTIADLNGELVDANKTIADLNGELVDANKLVDNLTAELDQANITQLTNDLAEATQRVSNLTTQLEEAQANATKLAENLADANGKVDNLTAELDQANITKLTNDLADATQRVSNLTTQLEEAQANATKLADDLADANKKAENLTSELADAKDNATQLNNELSDANKKVENLSTELADAKDNATQLNNELSDANKKVENLSTQLADVQSNVTVVVDGVEYPVNVVNGTVTIKTNGTKPVVKKDTVLVVDQAFTRAANDYSAGERGEMFYAILKDSEGNVLANKTVQIALNGKIYINTTDDEGRAGLQVNLASAGTYTYALSFQGDDTYNAAPMASSKLTVTKKKTTIKAAKKAFKAKTKTKKITVTLKTVKNPYDGKKYLKSGKKLTLKVNGKTYTAKINSKGKATFKITKLTKKGKYTATIKFAGDKTYKASNKKIKITVK